MLFFCWKDDGNIAFLLLFSDFFPFLKIQYDIFSKLDYIIDFY